MKTFKDIKFKQHRLGKGHIQGLLMLDNGIEFSVVAGTGMYSAGKNGVRGPVDDIKDVSSFEVAIFAPDGKFIESEAGQTLGWQSREDINKLIQIHA
tara:strand:+ start:207 stop:497 length:291 start_codon:yes stop_codon:yes gene_type:complete